MARRRRPHEQSAHTDTPAQQDEADIVEEVGAVPSDDGPEGELVADLESIRKIGAVDSDSVIENRRLKTIVDKKRSNVSGVAFNAGDLFTKYETLIKIWPANTIDINVKRLTGDPIQQVITSRPRSAPELHAALLTIHGQHEAAKYEVKLFDNNSKEFRGNAQIVLPDTRPATQQGQPPMNFPNQVPPGYPPGYVPGWSQAQPQTQPTVQVMPQAFDPNPMLTMMEQMFRMFQQMQASAQPPSQPAPQPASTTIPPMPPPTASPAEQMAWMQQAFQIFQQMQQPVSAPRAPLPAPAPAPASPVAGIAETMTLFQQMFQMFRDMQPPPAPQQREPYRGPRSPYYPQGDSNSGPFYPGPGRYQAAPQRPPSVAEQFQDAMATVRTAASMVQQMRNILPEQEQPDVGVFQPDKESPIDIIDTGAAKLIVNKKDGSLRKWETAWANSDRFFKWIGEQREAIQKMNSDQHRAQAQAQRPPTRVLPPNYVEVEEGYQPPPGYKAVVVDPSEIPEQSQELPPPPEHVPPPIQQSPWGTPAADQRPQWGRPPEGR